MDSRTGVDRLDAAPPGEAARTLRACADVTSWVDALVAGRPWGSADRLLDEADRLARRWTDDEVAAALARHPRIGERSVAPAAEAAMSAREQSDVGDDTAVAAALRAGNAAYEERFGRVFMIRAAGRSGAEILDALRSRLTHEPDVELRVVAGELREIAMLRLREVLA